MLTVIEVNNLVKEYNKERVLNNISFTVKKGEIFGFLGPNGAGKTTTIRILTGLLEKTSGGCRLLGQDIDNIDRSFYHRIGVVFEENNLYQRLSGYHNLKLFADMYNVNYERIEELLSKFGLKTSSQKLVRKYSKGMKQRLLICRALLHKPELVILDEPTGGLDPTSVEIIHQAITEFKASGGTVFISTHFLEEADKLCDRLAFLNIGKIIAIDYPELLKEQYGTPILEIKVINKNEEFLNWVKSILRDNDTIKTEESYSLIQLSFDNKEIGEMIDRIKEKTRVLSIHSREANLRDIFITLTGNEIECN